MKLEMTKKEDFFPFFRHQKSNFPFLGTKKEDFPFLGTKKDDFLFWLPKKKISFFGCQKKQKYLFLGGKNPFLVEKNCSVRPRKNTLKCVVFRIKRKSLH